MTCSWPEGKWGVSVETCSGGLAGPLGVGSGSQGSRVSTCAAAALRCTRLLSAWTAPVLAAHWPAVKAGWPRPPGITVNAGSPFVFQGQSVWRMFRRLWVTAYISLQGKFAAENLDIGLLLIHLLLFFFFCSWFSFICHFSLWFSMYITSLVWLLLFFFKFLMKTCFGLTSSTCVSFQQFIICSTYLTILSQVC